MQESNSFHYICIVILKDGTGVNLMLADPAFNDYDAKMAYEESVLLHMKAGNKVLFICAFEDNVLDLQAELDEI